MNNKLITILKILVLVVLFCWILIVFIDCVRARKGESPIFSISQKVNEYEDGSNTIYYGVGYKVIQYKRSCMGEGIEFGFFVKERKCE